jgi:4-amino-4-deoxy-L-arabinose transferase-like glycosyltransferase
VNDADERADLRRRPESMPRSKIDLAFGIGLFLVALVLRMVVAHAVSGEPVWDGHYYDFGARHIASGFGYADEVMRDGQPVWHPWCHYPVGYSGFLAAFYILFGATHAVAGFANALVGALLAVVTYLLAREALSPRRAMVAGALVAFHPGLMLYGALLMTEPLSALLVLAGFWVAIRIARTAGSQRALLGIAAGAFVLGVSALVRPQGLLCVPFLVLVIRAAAGASAGVVWRARGIGLVVACVVALLPVLPWTARNCRVMDGCALVSTNAGWNLAIGSFPRATGRFETLRSDDGCREVTGQVQQDRCWFDYGIANIAHAPGRWLALIPAKLAFTFDHESFAVEYLHEARPAAWPDERRALVRGVLTSVHRFFVAASVLAFLALAVPIRRRGGASGASGAERVERVERVERTVQTALLGALALASYAAFAASTPTFWPIVLVTCVLPWLPLPGRPPSHAALLMPISLLATTALTHAIFFGEDRYHMVATPVLCLLAAAALRAPARVSARPE